MFNRAVDHNGPGVDFRRRHARPLIGAIGSRPINTSRILQGCRCLCWRRPCVQLSRGRSSVNDGVGKRFSRETGEIANNNVWRSSIEASRHRIWRGEINTDKGVIDRINPLVDVDAVGRWGPGEDVPVPWRYEEKVTEWDEVLGEEDVLV